MYLLYRILVQFVVTLAVVIYAIIIIDRLISWQWFDMSVWVGGLFAWCWLWGLEFRETKRYIRERKLTRQ